MKSGARLVSSLLAGVAAGLATALFDLCWGAPALAPISSFALGVAAIVAINVSLGVVVGVGQGFLLLAALDAGSCSRAASGLRQVVAAVLLPGPPEREARRVGRATAGAVVGGGGLLWAWLLSVRAAPHIAHAPEVAVVYAVTLAVGLAIAVAVFSPLESLLTRVAYAGCRRSQWLALRTLLALAAVAALAGIIVAWTPLSGLLRALDLSPFWAAGCFIVVDVIALVILATEPELVERIRSRLGRRAVLVAFAVLLVSWALTAGPGSNDRGAVAAYRGEAPMARELFAELAASLDRDGDGYSSFFGDGDCAPEDEKRNPGAREIAGNGVDEDCFDGDLSATDDPHAPPPPHPRPAGLGAKTSFVVLLVDTLRPSHMGVYGYERQTTPNIDRWADKAVVFKRAYSASTYTAAAVSAFASSQFPSMVGEKVMRKKVGILSRDIPLVGELFAEAGWATGLFTDATSNPSHGLERGFTTKGIHHKRTEKIADGAVKFIDAQGDAPFFLLAYYIGPHAPYVKRDGYPDFGSQLVDLYDNEIAYTDGQLAPILERVAQPDLADRVVVVLVSDHGEAFGEHGTYYHGHNLYDENALIPMIISAPGVSPRRLASAPVSLLDVLPTLLNLAGLEAPEQTRGFDLTRELVTGEERLDRHVFIESHFNNTVGYRAAVVTARHKLIERAKARTFVLFDLETDPGEKKDIALREPDRVVELRRALNIFKSRAVKR